MAYSFKTSISFGLVYIPVTLQRSVRERNISFNMLDRKTMSRVKYLKTCLDCEGRQIKNEDIVKGYQYEENKYVIFEDEDFEKIKTKRDKSITIELFVDVSEIDPIYYDTAYYVLPNGGDKAFALLVSAMEGSGKIGIAKTVLGTKETLIALRARGGVLLLNTLFFYDEIVKNPANPISTEVNKKELKMAEMIIESMSGYFKASDFKDEYRERLEQAITDKINGKSIYAPKEKRESALDLMQALEKSLAQMKSQKTGKTLPKMNPQKKEESSAKMNSQKKTAKKPAEQKGKLNSKLENKTNKPKTTKKPKMVAKPR